MTIPTQPRVQIELTVLGQSLAVEASQPPEQARFDQVLPFFRKIDDRVIELKVLQTEGQGQEISCKKGCSTCCRAQPVPVTPPEAYALLRLVETLPERNKLKLRRRFDDCVTRLKEAGLTESFLQRTKNLDQNQAREIADRYFRLGLVCPFLEEDSCSIYPDRPFVCRQYLVTSPAELCRDPFQNPVEVVSMPLTPATATLAITEKYLGKPQFTIPLILALEYAQAHQSELERTYPAQELVVKWLSMLSSKSDEVIAINPQ